MRLMTLIAAALALPGCAQLQEAQRQMQQNRMNAIEATCARYGFIKGSPEFGQCMMQTDQNARAAQQRADAEYQRTQNEIYRQQMENIRSNRPPPQINCTSTTSYGTTRTTCQ